MQSMSCNFRYGADDNKKNTINIKQCETAAKEECSYKINMLKDYDFLKTVQPDFPAALLSNTRAASERGYLTQVTWSGLSFP